MVAAAPPEDTSQQGRHEGETVRASLPSRNAARLAYQGFVKRLLVVLALAAVTRLIAGFAVDAEGEQFTRDCQRVTEGMSYAEARRSFGAPDNEPGNNERTFSTAFLFHSGWTGMQCTLELHTGRVAARRIERWHDLDGCSSRENYPRRFWLCRVGRVLLP